MPTSPSILPPDDPVSFPSMPTMHGGDPDALGRIDHYDLLRKLGGGGFGVVYLAKDTNSGVEVALKTLHPLLKTNAEEMDALREKFALVSRLTHTNIAKALVLHRVADVNIWDEAARKEMRLSPGDSVMVMDYAPGVTLSRWRRQFPDGVVPLDLALEIARQVASALDYAHGERIVHRDIKPGNIMVETLGPLTGFQDGQEEQDAPGVALAGLGNPVKPENRVHPVSKLRVRLLDFGLAAEIRSSMSRVSTETGDTSGTRPYMAPEQWLGRKQDGRTDQYALACVLYELLSGAPPFAGVFETGDPAIMMATVKSENPDEIEDVPEAVNAALLRALSKTPKERFPSCAEFVAALDGTTKDTKYTKNDAGRDAPTARPGGASRSGEPRRRRGIVPWLLVAAAAVVTIVAVDHVWNVGEVSRMEAERKAREEAEETARRKRQEAANEKARADLKRLQDAAEKTLQNLAPYRKWAGEGKFKPLFSTLDTEKAVLDAFSEAADFDKALEIARRLRDTAFSISSKGKEREIAEAERKAREEAERKLAEERKAREEAEAQNAMDSEPKAKKIPTVSNVTMSQLPDSRLVVIKYMLTNAAAFVVLDIQTNCVENGETNWITIGSPVYFAEGDVWKTVEIGEHAIVWDCIKTWPGHYIADGGMIRAVVSAYQSEREAHEADEARKAEVERKAREEEAARKAAEEARLAAIRKNLEHDRVQLWAGGPYWATKNIGAENPWDSGLYFWWGDTVGYRREGDAWVASDGSSWNFKFSVENTPTLGKDNATLRREGWITPAGVLAQAHDAAQAHWGGNWRMPTRQEIFDLNCNCDWTWTTTNGVNGYVVRGRGGYASASIFLPAAGIGTETSLSNAGSDDNYWSSVPYSDTYVPYPGISWGLNLNWGRGGVNGYSRDFGQSVRPVQGFTE